MPSDIKIDPDCTAPAFDEEGDVGGFIPLVQLTDKLAALRGAAIESGAPEDRRKLLGKRNRRAREAWHAMFFARAYECYFGLDGMSIRIEPEEDLDHDVTLRYVVSHESLKWTAAQTRDARNYEAGMVVTFNRPEKGFNAGEFAEVSRVAEGSVFVRADVGERHLPLRSGAFSVARARRLEVAGGDRLLIRANDRRSGVLNGEIVTVERIDAGVIQTTDGRRIDTRRFGEFTHGFAVTSHASQSKTAEHVVVAAERLNAKAAYVACSRGQMSCVVHTPDKTALLDRLPDGNREAALDLLGSDESLTRKALDRTWAWAQSAASRARMLPEAVRRIAARFFHRRNVDLDAAILQAQVPHSMLDLSVHHSSSARPDHGPSMSL